MRTKPINSPAHGRRLKRVVRPTGGKPSAAYKEAWMAGARSGSDMAFELMMRSLENIGKTMRFKRSSRPNAALSGSDQKP